MSRDISPPPGLEPGSLGREPSVLTSQTIAESDEAVGQGAGLPGGGWLELPLVSLLAWQIRAQTYRTRQCDRVVKVMD